MNITMKKLSSIGRWSFLFLLSAIVITTASSAHAQSVIAFWDFNDGFDAGADQVQVAHSATIGSGTIYQQLADIDGNGKGGVDYMNSIFGINAAAGRGIAWDDVAKSGANDAEMFLEFSTLGFTDIQISFDLQGNDMGGINRYDLKYDNNPLEDITDPNGSGVLIKDFMGGNSTTFANNVSITTSIDSYTRFTVDLSGEAAANNQANFAVRFDDIQENDDARFDNFLIIGTAVPEPSSLAVCMLALGGVCLRRKRA